MPKSVATSNPMQALQAALGERYTIYGELGRGGMGIVYLVHDPKLDRPVALKLLPPTAAAPWRDRFFEEARIAGQLSHPNIVAIHAVEEAGDFVFYTMPFVEGETLGERIRDRGALPVGEVTRIIHDVARAVGYAHACGVVHRDLKPDNILLEAETDRPMVLDFGLAQRGEDVDAAAGYLRGTMAFVSPERVRGQPADVRSDIYALGVTAFAAAAGRLPFQPTHPDEILQAHFRLAVPRLEARGQDGDATLANVVAKCLAEDPQNRFQTADELVRALAAAPEMRGETPVAMRVFVTRAHRLARAEAGLSVLLFGGAGTLVVGALSGDGAMMAGAGAALAVLAGTTIVTMLPAVRRVLKAGGDRTAMVEALASDVARREQELAFELGGDPSARGRWGRRLAYGALGGTALAAAWLAAGLPGAIIALGALFLSVPVAVAAGLVGHVRARRPRQMLAGAMWLTLWRGRVGHWATRLAGIGLRAPEAALDQAAVRKVSDLVDMMNTYIWRIRACLEAPDTIDDAIREDFAGQVMGNLAALTSLRSRLETNEPGRSPRSLTADLAAARRVCEMVQQITQIYADER